MEEVRVERTTYIVIDDEKDAAPDTTASAKMDIAATRERISDTIADIEQRMSDKVASAKAKVDVVGLIKENPWPALVIGFAAGLALSATGADRKAAHATADAAKRAPDAAKRGAASAARATAAGVSQLAAAAVEKVKGSPGDDATETAEPSGLMAKAKGAIRELGDEIRRGADELSAAARPTKNAGI
jgi:ElaB/YqjD/DUF883 family membrane-anchored ribosome-binding protein